jgi:hypothetical protein
LVVEQPRQILRFAKTASDPVKFSERMERGPKVEAKVDRLHLGLAGRGQMLQNRQRLLEIAGRLPVGRSCQCLRASVTQVRDCLLPDLTAHRMMGQPLDVLAQPVGIRTLDGIDDADVNGPAPLLEHGAVGNLVSERMLEGVLAIREDPRLVQELGCL